MGRWLPGHFVASDLFLRLGLNLLLLLGNWSNLFGGRRPRALRRDLERGAAQRSGRLSPRVMAGATGGGAAGYCRLAPLSFFEYSQHAGHLDDESALGISLKALRPR
jgi:hypothetical protein